MGSVLSVDDIERGQIVSFHSFHHTRPDAENSKSVSFQCSLGRISAGTPMRVKAISLPFLACELLAPNGEKAGPVIIDVRCLRLCQLDKEYADYIVDITQKNPQERAFEDEIPF